MIMKSSSGLITAILMLICTTSYACSQYNSLPIADGNSGHPDGKANDDAGGSEFDCLPIEGCNPQCPEGSVCCDLDGIGAPECVWPTGRLACTSDFTFPHECQWGCKCYDGVCGTSPCECASDDVCNWNDVFGFCIDEGCMCGACVTPEPYECMDDSDCVIAVSLGDCCSLPVPRNISYVHQERCFEEYLYSGPADPECAPDYCDLVNHCLRIPEDPMVVSCSRGRCTLDPMPRP